MLQPAQKLGFNKPEVIYNFRRAWSKQHWRGQMNMQRNKARPMKASVNLAIPGLLDFRWVRQKGGRSGCQRLADPQFALLASMNP